MRAVTFRLVPFTMIKTILISGVCLSLMMGTALADEKKAVIPASMKGKTSTLPFSPAILKDGVLYVSGQTGPGADGKIPEDFEAEVANTLDAIKNIMKEAGFDLKDALTVQVYLTDMTLFPKMNNVYIRYFPEPRPARTTVGVAKLVGTSRVEITVTAKR